MHIVSVFSAIIVNSKMIIIVLFSRLYLRQKKTHSICPLTLCTCSSNNPCSFTALMYDLPFNLAEIQTHAQAVSILRFSATNISSLTISECIFLVILIKDSSFLEKNGLISEFLKYDELGIFSLLIFRDLFIRFLLVNS